MKITIDVEVSPGVRRRVRSVVLLAVVAGAVVAWAGINTSWVANGQPVSAALLKGNLDDLQTQITALEQGRILSFTNDAGVTTRTTTFGKFCAASAPTNGAVSDTGRGLTGYRATKSICETTCGVSTAHMCTAAEVIASTELGMDLPTGWIVNGSGLLANANYIGMANVQHVDCFGWNENRSTFTSSVSYLFNGSVWVGASGNPANNLTTDGCGQSHPLMCCN